MSPIAARIKQVIPAPVAMNTHFSHISKDRLTEARLEPRAR